MVLSEPTSRSVVLSTYHDHLLVEKVVWKMGMELSATDLG
ncbi:hypothetical protein TorRG33x02_332840 [Trema orientale]|uniref:Uncharacterized protein n=1 Tax=Trema orientale TaxID=63057 RepID=A0A2P5B4X6_TREOI|nr:hypothetical protein TorRG33x02_332840 [Trema orientale]